MKRYIILLISLVISYIIFAAADDNTLIYGELSNPKYLWPYFSDDPVTLRMLDLYFRPLIYNFSDSENAPRDYIEILVERLSPDDIHWERSPHLFLTLRDGVKWKNGRDITPEDVIYTFKLLKRGPVETVYKFVVNTIRDIRSVGDRKIAISFSFPSKSLLSALNFFILPHEVLSKGLMRYMRYRRDLPSYKGENLDIKKWSNGPYYLSSTSENEYQFRINRNYIDLPNIRKIVMKVQPDINALVDNLLAGDFDMIVDIPPSLATAKLDRAPGITAHHFVENRFYYVSFNYRIKEFQNREFRIMLAKALDRKELAKSFGLDVYDISGPFVPGSIWGNEKVKPWDFDPNVRNEKLLRQFNKRTGSYELLYPPGDPNVEKLAASLAAQWRGAGLNVKLVMAKRLMDFWRRLRTRKYDMAILEYSAARSFVALKPLLTCSGNQNFSDFNCPGIYVDSDVKDILDKVEGVKSFDVSPEVRLDMYRKLHEILRNREVQLWLFTAQRSIYHKSGLSVGYISPSRPFKTIELWRWTR